MSGDNDSPAQTDSIEIDENGDRRTVRDQGPHTEPSPDGEQAESLLDGAIEESKATPRSDDGSSGDTGETALVAATKPTSPVHVSEVAETLARAPKTTREIWGGSPMEPIHHEERPIYERNSPEDIERKSDLWGVIFGLRGKIASKRYMSDRPDAIEKEKDAKAREDEKQRIMIQDAMRTIAEMTNDQIRKARGDVLALYREGVGTKRQLDKILELLKQDNRPPLTPGLILGQFELVGRLGSGGVAQVWRARTRAGRSVALKILHLHHSDDGGDAKVRFQAGLRALLRLRHPRIPRLVESGTNEDKGYNFYAYNYIPGDDLEKCIARLTREHVFRVINDVGCALEHAHSLSIFHRDVSPHNIVVDSEGRGNLIDFDLVRGRGYHTFNGDRKGFGRVVYSPPEAAKNAASMDALADVYGLGMTLLFALLGEQPSRNARSVGSRSPHYLLTRV